MLQPPYDLRSIAESAGTGQHTPIPQEPPCCVSCGCVVPSGRIYCSQRGCIRKHNSSGKTAERRYDPFPTIGTYNA